MFYLSSFVNHTLLQYSLVPTPSFYQIHYWIPSFGLYQWTQWRHCVCRLVLPLPGLLRYESKRPPYSILGTLPYKYGVYTIYLTCFFSLLECIIKTKQIIQEIKARNLNMTITLAPAIYFYLIVLINGLWILLEPELFRSNPRIIFTYNAAMASDILVSLYSSFLNRLDRIDDCTYLRSSLSWTCLQAPSLVVYWYYQCSYTIYHSLSVFWIPFSLYSTSQPVFDSYTVVHMVAIVSLYNIFRRSYSVIRQMSTELNVPIFKARKEEKQE